MKLFLTTSLVLLSACSPSTSTPPEAETATPDNSVTVQADMATIEADTVEAERPVAASAFPLGLLPVGKYVGPRLLPDSIIGPATLRRLQAETAGGGDMVRIEYFADDKFMSIEYIGGAPVELYMRRQPRDTSWHKIDLQVDERNTGDKNILDVEEIDMDHTGRPELFVTISSGYGGSGSQTEYRTLNVIDVSKPRAVRLLVAAVEKTYSLLGTIDESQERFSGCRRAFKQQNGDMLLRPVERFSKYDEDCELSSPVAGRYRYRKGRMYRIK